MDKKTQTQLGITGILVVILLFLTNSAIHDVAKIKSNAQKKIQDSIKYANDNAPGVGTSIPASGNKLSSGNGRLYKKLLKINEGLSITRDPFFYFSGLTAILWNDDQPLAVINHQVVKKGDKISNVIVVEINKDNVILNDGGKEFELYLRK